jgi:hypothetical protein
MTAAAFLGLAVFTADGADTLFAIKITVTGTIDRQGKRDHRLSKRYLLDILGDTNVPDEHADYFYDETQDSFVLASRDEITIYGTVLAESQTGDFSWHESSDTLITSGSCTSMSGGLTGTYRDHLRTGQRSSVDSIKFLVSGDTNGADTVIDGVVTALFPRK